MAMKSGIFMVAVVMLITMAAFVSCASAADTEKMIHVSGTGMVTTDPDLVEVSLAVQTENPDGVLAQQENAKKMNDCIAALKALGFTDEELKTTGYSMYSYTTGSDSVFGKDKKVYRVTNTLLVKTDKIDMAGQIIDTAIANGANNVNYISFKLSDEKSQSLRSAALAKAVAQARSDADAVSAALGVSIMGVQNVNVGASYTPYTYAETSYKSVAMDAVGSAPTPIQADTVDVTASVSIDYIIR